MQSYINITKRANRKLDYFKCFVNMFTSTDINTNCCYFKLLIRFTNLIKVKKLCFQFLVL